MMKVKCVTCAEKLRRNNAVNIQFSSSNPGWGFHHDTGMDVMIKLWFFSGSQMTSGSNVSRRVMLLRQWLALVLTRKLWSHHQWISSQWKSESMPQTSLWTPSFLYEKQSKDTMWIKTYCCWWLTFRLPEQQSSSESSEESLSDDGIYASGHHLDWLVDWLWFWLVNRGISTILYTL